MHQALNEEAERFMNIQDVFIKAEFSYERWCIV